MIQLRPLSPMFENYIILIHLMHMIELNVNIEIKFQHMDRSYFPFDQCSEYKENPQNSFLTPNLSLIHLILILAAIFPYFIKA